MRRRRRRRSSGPSLSYMYKEKRFHIGMFYEVLTWSFIVVASIVLGIILVYLFGIKTSVVGPSMEPNLYNGQEVLINRVAFQFAAPKRGDVIAFRPNGNVNTHLSVKRVIGVPGDSVQISNGSVYINDEEYKDDVSDDTFDGGIAIEKISLGPDEYFVLGDNRFASEDSRSANIGNVSRSMIEGKVWLHMKFNEQSIGVVH